MNNIRLRLRAGVAMIAVSLIVIGVNAIVGSGPADTGAEARSLSRKVAKRLSDLDGFMGKALEDQGPVLSFKDFPEDMVIYRYRADTLQAWAHQFPLLNDEISDKTVIERLWKPRFDPVSPLAEVGPAPSFVNYGSKWYVVKALTSEDTRVIGGIEIVNDLDTKVSRFKVRPLSNSVGATVEVAGTPLFKVTSESPSDPAMNRNYAVVLVALILILIGSMLVLSARRTWLSAALVALLQMGLLTCVYLFGLRHQGSTPIFSPILYADGPFLYSLGALLAVNLAASLVVFDICIMRSALRKIHPAVGLTLTLFVLVGMGVMMHKSLVSVQMNSGIVLELYKIDQLSWYSALVWADMFIMWLTFPIMVWTASPWIGKVTGKGVRVSSESFRIVFALAGALYLMAASSILGFRKEQSRVAVWSNRLAMDRDISLELQLRTVEDAVASDPVIAAVSALPGTNELIRNRLEDTYMNRISRDYDITVLNLSQTRQDAGLENLFNASVRDAAGIADGSRFFYSRDITGRARYTGFFTFFNPQSGVSSIMVFVESKSNREDRGYLSLLGISGPGRVSIPVNYSYAKYVSDKLVTYKGTYPYPTRLKDEYKSQEDGTHIVGGYMHFIHKVSEDETILISREEVEPLFFIVVVVLFALAIYFLLILVTGWGNEESRKDGERHYFKSRIDAVIYTALTVSLVAMASFSVWFVYQRNEADIRSALSSKIISIQSLLQTRMRQVQDESGLRDQEVRGTVEMAANTLKSDISLYTPSGSMAMTTTPEVFDRMIIGHRINENVLNRIVYGNERYCICREKISKRIFYTLYAPIFNAEGKMIAIVASPYSDRNYNLASQAALHIAAVIAAFLLLLVIARLVTATVIARLFRPLSEMGEKMNVSDIDHLEYIIYEQDDEVSSLVTAYNRMVHDLSDSTRQLAQAERDKAWSEMARQVAHEIKNPLTPIKLQLQMLIRMKQSGNPSWAERFDEVSSIVLEHIDILADTANEFSTFARLYSEDPVEIDLDAMIREEVTMFSNRSDIEIEYLGLPDAIIHGPKPQLTRVLVNLITNAIQAVEEKSGGKVTVSLRLSTRPGYYDIVVEDNGPGVRDEDRAKLFTPNFTTKSRGTGLGLAICRNIIERCNGEILYSKSFTLGGACFTVRYPKG